MTDVTVRILVIRIRNRGGITKFKHVWEPELATQRRELVDITVIEVQVEPSELEETKLGHKHISIPLPIILLD